MYSFKCLPQKAAALCRQSYLMSQKVLQNEAQKYSSYRSHRDWDANSKVSYEVSTDPTEWKYVERLLPDTYIPEPTPKEQYTSGWWPQKSDLSKNEPYTVRRSKNHMLPVYLKIGDRGLRRLTVIRYIRGDIWTFEQDIRQYLMEKLNKPSIGVRVDEVAGKIILRGDFVHYVSEWFKEKGF